MKKSIIVVFLLFSAVTSAFAHDECSRLLDAQKDKAPVGATQMIPSGRDADVFPTYEKAVEIIFGKGGVAERLGYALPDHQIEFVPSAELSMLASLGRHPVPHWHDGSIVETQAHQAAGTLEFVTPGCPTCRSFYTDTSSPKEQLSILFHVAGHNDFAAHSMYNLARLSDAIADSLKLAALMDQLYETYDHDEVSNWYQLLLSFAELQDLSRGTFDAPEGLVTVQSHDRITHVLDPNDPARSVYPTTVSPKTPTPSVLQHLVSNLPPEAPKWKKEVLELFERIYRVYGYYTQTKVMNEGWAVSAQYIIPMHSPWNTTEDAVDFGQLMQGVAYQRLDNPYWLGRECWKRLYQKFRKNPEIQKLPPLEQTQRFLDYAHDLIREGNDYDFIRLALDEQWVVSRGMYLSRKAEWNEQDQTLKPEQGKEQKLVVSQDPERVIRKIARQYDRRLSSPRIFVENVNGGGLGVVVLRHEIVDGMPLERFSAAQTLYNLAKAYGKTVRLKTVRSTSWDKVDNSHNGGMITPFPYPWGPRPSAPALEIKPIVIEVQPNGNVSVFEQYEDGTTSAGILGDLTEELKTAVDHYRADLMVSDNPDLSARERELYAPMVKQIVEHNTRANVALFSHAPTAAKAVLEYGRILEARTDRALRLAAQGKLPVRKGRGGGVVIKVLPSIPKFSFDRKVLKKMKDALPPAPVEMTRGAQMALPPHAEKKPDPDDALDIGQGKGRKKGDRFWGDGKGKGNGDGESEEGDESSDDDGDEPNKGPGGKPKDPSEVEVPLEVYGKILQQEIGLPNVRRTDGGNDVMDTVREGSTQRPYGDVLWDRTVNAAIAYGKLHYKKKVKNLSQVTKGELLKKGFGMLQPSDYRVIDRVDLPQPDMNAVVVFVVDMTGSMMGRPQEVEKELVFNIKALLSANYKKIVYRFVGYDNVAYEFPEDKIFKAMLGGGNTDSKGFEKADEILDEYPAAKWNKYVIGMGDGGSTDTEATVAAMEKIYPKVQYMGWAHVDIYNWNGLGGQFVEGIRSLATKHNWFGFAKVSDDRHSVLNALKEFFGKKAKK